MVGRISSENQVNPAFSHTSIEELLQLIRHEKNGEKLLAYVNELIKFDSSEFDDVIQYATDKLLGNSPEWKTSRQVMVKEKFSNPKDSTFVKNLTLARIGADFSPNHGDYYLNLLRNNYLKNSFSKDSLEATSAKNEYVRGNALLTLVQQQVNAQTYLLLKQHLTDESAFVRRCSVQGISEFAKTSRKHQLITETREIRQMLLSHMIHEKDKQVLHLMEKSLFDLEHNPNQANFTPLCAPTVLDLPFSSSRRLEYHGPVEYHMKQLEKKAS
jgi:hypothetical protein